MWGESLGFGVWGLEIRIYRLIHILHHKRNLAANTRLLQRVLAPAMLRHMTHGSACASHITHHTSHIPHHTSHVTRHLLSCVTGGTAVHSRNSFTPRPLVAPDDRTHAYMFKLLQINRAASVIKLLHKNSAGRCRARTRARRRRMP